MKKALFFFLLIAINTFSQENKEPKFDFSVSYGISYIDYAHYIEEPLLNLELTTIGKFYEFNLDYKLPKNRYIGMGFSRQQHSKNIDDGFLYNDSSMVPKTIPSSSEPLKKGLTILSFIMPT